MKNVRITLLSPTDEPILAGRLLGKRAFVKALEELPAFSDPTLVVLDFVGAEYATSSYLSELLLPLRDHVRLRQAQGYVVVANLSQQVREEVEEYLRRLGEAVLACTVTGDGNLRDVAMVGRLDEKLRETFETVVRKGEASAVELHAESKGPKQIGPTAFNNRLATLAAKSLLLEITQGRAKKYRPLLEIA